MARLFVTAGRSAGVGRRELVDAIGSEAGLAPRDIGMIDVAERFSLVDVPGEVADQVIEALQGIRIKGTRIAVRHDRVGGR
jgi:ATP-dependent RNA helicase DeaD